jgi:acyl dehydratase
MAIRARHGWLEAAFMSALPPYHVAAYNTAKSSENKIHDDATAKRFGFKGGLVGGVHVYAYMSHMPVQRWGRAWLERGTGEARFGKPVYEGDIAEITAADDANGMTLQVDSGGVLCATGRAGLPDTAQGAPVLADFRAVPARVNRVGADEQSLKVGDWLGMNPLTVTPDYQSQDISDTRETDPIYLRDGIVHSGTILRCCNWALSHNVILPAWMHMGSTVQNHGVALVGDTLNVRARVTKNYEHKGHKWVEIDALVIANEARPIARVTHIAIYRPRQLAEAA